MHTGHIPVCNIGVYGDNAKKFRISGLDNLTRDFPILCQPHKQDFYAFLIIDEAAGAVHIDGRKIVTDTPGIIIIKPGCIATITLAGEARGRLICFAEEFFSLRYNNNILNQFSFLQGEAAPYIPLMREQMERMGQLLDFLQEEFLQQRPGADTALRSYLNIFLFELERLYHPAEAVKSLTVRQEKMQRFRELVGRNFKEKKLPSDYADMLNVSPNYLNKICREETGETAGCLIRKHITVEARRLLHYTNYSVKEIAAKLGFGHSSYFVTFFKKQTMQTPELFRKSNYA